MGRPVDTIRGERINDQVWLQRPALIQRSTIRIPLWAMAAGWCVKTLWRLVLVLFRAWWLTGPLLAVAGVWLSYGWQPLVWAAVVVVVGLVGWWSLHPATYRRWCWWPTLGRWRRWLYRRRWWSAMATAGLVVRFNGREVLPVLKRVTCRTGVDVLAVRMVTGQIPEDFTAAVQRFTHTFGVTGVRVAPGRRPGRVVLTMIRTDPLAGVVDPLPVTAVPDFTALPLGVCENGGLYELCLFGTHVLVAGATGSGKGSVIWSLIQALAGGIASGLVELWGFDPKGGMELGGGLPLFTRFACDSYADMADLLDQAVSIAQTRAARLRGTTRQHTPTVAEPLIVLVVDELAALTAYLPDRKIKERVRMALSLLLSQGRAVGVHVLAAVQDPRKEVLPFRDLFPTRIGLRLTEPTQVDLVLGDGARNRGAWCDHIPTSMPGVGYVVLDGDPTPVRVRFTYLTDHDITDLAHTYGRLRVIDGEASTHHDTQPAGDPDDDEQLWRHAA